MEDKQLAPRSEAQLVDRTSLPASQRLSLILDFAAENAKVELSAVMAYELGIALRDEPIEAVEYAFRERIRASRFFPSIAEIVDLITEWKRRQRELALEKRQADEKAETARRLAAR